MTLPHCLTAIVVRDPTKNGKRVHLARGCRCEAESTLDIGPTRPIAVCEGCGSQWRFVRELEI